MGLETPVVLAVNNEYLFFIKLTQKYSAGGVVPQG